MSSPLPSSSSTLSWLVSDPSGSWGGPVWLPVLSHRMVEELWLEPNLWRGGVLWSPGLKDWDTPVPPLVKPIPQPWRDPSLRRPPDPERRAGVPGTEMSGSGWCPAFLTGDGETGALRGSEIRNYEFKLKTLIWVVFFFIFRTLTQEGATLNKEDVLTAAQLVEVN